MEVDLERNASNFAQIENFENSSAVSVGPEVYGEDEPEPKWIENNPTYNILKWIRAYLPLRHQSQWKRDKIKADIQKIRWCNAMLNRFYANRNK